MNEVSNTYSFHCNICLILWFVKVSPQFPSVLQSLAEFSLDWLTSLDC